MNRNIKITIGLGLATIVAAAGILLICKKCKCACCKAPDLTAEACCDTKEQVPKE